MALFFDKLDVKMRCHCWQECENKGQRAEVDIDSRSGGNKLKGTGYIQQNTTTS
jgi:hypothetical protein